MLSFVRAGSCAMMRNGLTLPTLVDGKVLSTFTVIIVVLPGTPYAREPRTPPWLFGSGRRAMSGVSVTPVGNSDPTTKKLIGPKFGSYENGSILIVAEPLPPVREIEMTASLVPPL